MASRNVKGTGAKGTAKTGQPADASTATPEIGASTTTPATAVVEPSSDRDTASNTISGDGSGQTLPPIHSDAGQVTAAGVNAENPGGGDEAPDETPGLFIRAARGIESRRRAGHRFDRHGHGIALTALSDDQIAAFKSDPALIVEDALFPAQEL